MRIHNNFNHFYSFDNDDRPVDINNMPAVPEATRIATKQKIGDFCALINGYGNLTHNGVNVALTATDAGFNPFSSEGDVKVEYKDNEKTLCFPITYTDNGDIFFPVHPQLNGVSIKATVDTPIYNVNKIGATELYKKFLEYIDLVVENYGQEMVEMNNGQPTSLEITERDLDLALM